VKYKKTLSSAKKKAKAGKRNASNRKTKKAAKKQYRAAHARAGLVYKKAKKKKAAAKPNPARALKSKISQMKPNTWYDTMLSGAKVKIKRVGQGVTIRLPKKKR
jgi:FtsZ-interacting cell division protein YlmF